MLDPLRHHPFPVVTCFERALILTFAFPARAVEPLLPPGLELDTHGPWALGTAALVWSRGLRPEALPAVCGRDVFLAGYRLFTRLAAPPTDGPKPPGGRGLYILESRTDSRLLQAAGNLFTHYRYELCRCRSRWGDERAEVRLTTPGGEVELEVDVDLAAPADFLPSTSPFAFPRQARRYAGPLPWTFSRPGTSGDGGPSMLMVKGERRRWRPRPVAAWVRRCRFFESAPFPRPLRLASAFVVENLPYRWEKGVLVRLGGSTDASPGKGGRRGEVAA